MADYQRINRSEEAGVVSKVMTVFCTGIALLVTLALVLGLSIAHIVIGAMKWDAYCTEERISLWLVISGATGILTNIVSLCNRKDEENENKPKYPAIACLASVLGFFTLAWLIVGSVWILPYDAGVNFENCDQLLYLFAYWNILVVYILLGAICVLACLVGCCVVGCGGSQSSNV